MARASEGAAGGPIVRRCGDRGSNILLDLALETAAIRFAGHRGAGRFGGANIRAGVGKSWPVSYTHLDVYKRQLLRRVAAVCKPSAIVTTNTSGLPIARIAEGLPQPLSLIHI